MKNKTQELISDIQSMLDKNVDFAETKADVKIAKYVVAEIIKQNKKQWIGSKANGGFSNSIDLDFWDAVDADLNALL